MKKFHTKQAIAILMIATLAANSFLSMEAFSLTLSNSAKYSADDKKVYRVLQAGCTDGKYAYLTTLNKKGSYVKKGKKWVKTKKDVCKVTKVKMKSSGKWKKYKARVIKGKYTLQHGNDMTYNAVTKKLVAISKTSSLGSAKTRAQRSSLVLLSSKTLKAYKRIIMPYSMPIYSIAHNKKRNRYVAGVSLGAKFAILNTKFKQEKIFKEKAFPKDGYSNSRQGIECDDNYIYILYNRYKGGSFKNTLGVYTWEGKFAGLVDLSVSKGLKKKGKYETENMFRVGNTFYMGFYGANGKNPVHKIDLRIYKIDYNANDGTGKMNTTYLPYTTKTLIPKNTFKKSDYYFGSWNVYRKSVNKWLYTNGIKREWYKEGTAPKGYKKKAFANKGDIATVKTTHGTTLTLYAQWKKITPPSAPINFGITAYNDRFLARWVTPTNNGGGTIKGYEYTINAPGEADDWQAIPGSDKNTTSYYIDQLRDGSNLVDGADYTIKVRAKNSAGSGAAASGQATLIPLFIPPADDLI